MPKFLLNNIIRNNEAQVKIDGRNFSEEEKYGEVKKLQYTSKNGIIIVDGLFDLNNKEIPELLKIGNLKLTFSKELINSFKLKFDQPKISVKFYLSKESLDLIKVNINILKKKYANFDTDYKSYIKFNLFKFQNINNLFFLKDKEEEKNEEIEKSTKFTNKHNFISNIIKDIELKNENEEEIKNPFIKKSNQENDEEEIFNPFKQKFEEKKDGKEDEDKEIIKTKKNLIKKNNKYIQMKEIDSFKYPPYKKSKNNIISKYIPKNLQKLKENILYNGSLTINPNNTYPIVKANNNTQFIEIREIPLNKELKDLEKKYQNDIILSFLSILYNNNKFNNENGAMTINDYTSIVLSYIKYLENKVSDIKSKSNKLMNENKYIFFVQRIEKIISSLKLFQILFLNCFINNDIKTFNYKELFDEYLSLKVQTMRKTMLIEWCIEEEKKYIKNNKINIKDDDRDNKKDTLTRKIISFGQIKTAINTNHNKNLFINAKLSNLSKEEPNNIFSYYVKKQNSNTFISYNGDNKNNWISYFLQSLLYIEKSNEHIIKSIKLIDEKMKKEKDFPKPYLSTKNNDNREIFQLNYLLLKLYENIYEAKENKKKEEEKKNKKNEEEDKKEEEEEEKKEEEDKKKEEEKNKIEQFINMFSNNNLFETSNSDHFIQYIILYILSKIMSLISPDIEIASNFLNKKIYFLFNQIISEILSNKNNEVDDLILILKLLSTLNINKKTKKEIFINIICHQNYELIKKFWEKYEKEKDKEYFSLIDIKMKGYINGIHYMNECDWEKAYKCFLESEKYEYCMNAYMNYCFSLIKGKNINQINFEEIYNTLTNIQEKSFLFKDFYQDFYQLVSFVVYKDESDFNEIISLAEKYIKEYDKNENIIIEEKTHRLFIKLLYQVLLMRDRKDDELILGGDIGFFKLNNIKLEEKKTLLNDILIDIFYHKNNQFFNEEK